MYTKLVEAMLTEAAANRTILNVWHWASALGLALALLIIGTALATHFGGVPLWACTTFAETAAGCAKVRSMLAPLLLLEPCQDPKAIPGSSLHVFCMLVMLALQPSSSPLFWLPYKLRC
jgi:hypothetical protein